MHWEVFRVVRVLLILLKIKFGEKLAGFHNRVVAVLQYAIRIIYLQTSGHRQQNKGYKLADNTNDKTENITMWTLACKNMETQIMLAIKPDLAGQVNQQAKLLLHDSLYYV